MGVKKGDIIDEFKRHTDGCGLVIKVMGGGEGFEQVRCCGHELTEADVVTDIAPKKGRRRGKLPLGVILDEKKLHPESCGLRVMIMDGGDGFHEIICCGHSLTLTSMKELKYGQLRNPGDSTSGAPGEGFPGPAGTA